MNHRVANLHARGEGIQHETPHLALKNRNQVRKLAEVLLSSVNCRGQVSFEPAGNREHCFVTRFADEQRGRSEYLFFQVRFLQECGGVRFEQH